jgi:PhnB protein
MKSLSSYVIFGGNCRQAIEFYKKCFGGELTLMTYGQAPGACADFPECKDWIIHARITTKSFVLMASDTRPDLPVVRGNNSFISIECENIQEIEKLFKALGEKGEIKMPLQETFFATRFGMLADQFGTQWMLNLEKPH